MPIVLPDLQEISCVALRICGRARPLPDPAQEKQAAGETETVTRYENHGEVVFVRMVHTPREDGTAHLHFDFGTKRWFDRRKFAPKVNAGIEEFARKVEAFAGLRYEPTVDALLDLPVERLPPPISRIVREGRYEGRDEGFTLASGKLKFTGIPPLRSVSWEEGKQPGRYLLTVESRMPLVIGDDLFAHSMLIASTLLKYADLKGGEHE